MEINFELNNRILNTLTKIYGLHNRVYFALELIDSKTSEQIRSNSLILSAISGVIQDINSVKYLLRNNYSNSSINRVLEHNKVKKLFDRYYGTLKSFSNKTSNRSLLTKDRLIKTNLRLLGKKNDYDPIRHSEKIIKYASEEQGVVYENTKIVKTPQKDMSVSINELVLWINNNRKIIDPIIMSGLVQVKFAQIHPFTDGNARTGNLLAREVLSDAGIDLFLLYAIENYFLINQQAEFDLIELSILSNDFTRWLEFYLSGYLYSVEKAAEMIFHATSGLVDIQKCKIISLKDSERNVMKILKNYEKLNGSIIAKKLNMTRQNVNLIIHNLEGVGLVKCTGNKTKKCYELNVK